MRLLLFRHGLTDDNVNGIAQGSRDTPLNEEGRLQARKLAKQLSGISTKTIYTSPLCRARETGEIIGEALGAHKIISDPRLNELSFGIYEGKHFTELVEARNKNTGPIFEWRPTNGESASDAATRITPLLKTWLSEELIVAVGHGTTNRVIRAVLTGEIYNPALRQGNCCVNEFVGSELGKLKCLRWDETSFSCL